MNKQNNNMSRRKFLCALGMGIGCAGMGSLFYNGCARKENKPPNILFAISDDQSWPHTGINGCKTVNTPAFDRVAKNGILFNNAICAAPQCSPNRAALLTGRHVWQLEEAGTHASNFPKKFNVFPDLLENAGYEVAYTGKPWGPGNWEISGRKRNPAGESFNKIKYAEKPVEGIGDLDYSANFEDFMEKRNTHKPFCFWYGSSEPHRRFKKGIGLEAGKSPAEVEVPSFLPDTDIVREDILDYCTEIEWFDKHLGTMLDVLEQAGELENTLVVVTSDNGMAFPRAKANLYEYGTHVPLAIQWPAKVKSGRVVKDLISFTDYAPTFLEAASQRIPADMSGSSFLNILLSTDDGIINPAKKYIQSGRERHTHARPENFGYPIRSLRSQEYLYLMNLKPERWPAGDPMGEGGYFDVDASPSKQLLLDGRNDPGTKKYFNAAFAIRPPEELFKISEDPDCMNNLAESPQYSEIKNKMKKELVKRLKSQQDPRFSGKEDIFESYPRYSHMRDFDGFKERGAYNPKYK